MFITICSCLWKQFLGKSCLYRQFFVYLQCKSSYRYFKH
nr:MAG TPA: hypothetical protein [Crassvirales sp.]DAT58667.1 MAG TPA: hypothetical protein [Crassvirales sp.]